MLNKRNEEQMAETKFNRRAKFEMDGVATRKENNCCELKVFCGYNALSGCHILMCTGLNYLLERMPIDTVPSILH